MLDKGYVSALNRVMLLSSYGICGKDGTFPAGEGSEVLLKSFVPRSFRPTRRREPHPARNTIGGITVLDFESDFEADFKTDFAKTTKAALELFSQNPRNRKLISRGHCRL
jgi:hypothetical protein